MLLKCVFYSAERNQLLDYNPCVGISAKGEMCIRDRVDQAFENKCRSDIAVTVSTAGIMKIYEAVFKITSCLLFLFSALLYLWGVITLPYCLLFIICAFLMFMELELMNDGAFLSKMLATQLDLSLIHIS